MSNARVEANAGIDFLDCILQLVEGGFLVAGDILVMDNASIHDSAEICDALDALLQCAGVRLVFLPTYSPELNPCELVFAQVKSYLYHYRLDSEPFLSEISKALDQVSLQNVYNYYRKCITL